MPPAARDRPRARLPRRGMPVALPVTVDPPRSRRSSSPRSPHRRASRCPRPSARLGETRWRIPRGGSRELLALPGAGAKSWRSAGPAADALFQPASAAVDREPTRRDFAVTTAASRGRPAKDGPRSTCRAPRRRSSPQPCSTERRTAQLAVAVGSRRARRTTRSAMGITGVVSSYTTIYGGDAEPAPQRPARRAPHRRHADRAGTRVLVQRDDGRAQRRRRASSRRR